MSMPAPTATSGSPFKGSTVLWGVLASLLAAAGFVLLSTYAPDFRTPGQGGASALSKSGNGFAGLVELLGAMGAGPDMARDMEDLAADGLVVVTIGEQNDPEALKPIIKAREDLTTLFVLPKWHTVPLPQHEGWVTTTGRLSPAEVDTWLAQIMEARIGLEDTAPGRLDIAGVEVDPPADLQWAHDAGPLVAAGDGRGVLIESEDKPFYVLTDPDLLDNAALKDPQKAKAALALIDFLRVDDDPVIFDLTLHGAARKHDLLKLLLEPPFLALTLSMLVAAALALLHGLGRFGPPQGEARAIPFGKRSLVDTTALLMRRAGRLDRLGGRYAGLMRKRAGAILGAPQGLSEEALDQWLEVRDRNAQGGYAALSGATRRADNEVELTSAARKLHQWIAGRFRERR